MYIATKLGDVLDEIVVVGGLVPSLLISSGPETDTHVGTRDLDLGLQVAILDAGRYQDLTARLRQSGFSPDEKDGKQVSQRWQIDAGGQKVTVDFLIPPTKEKRQGGRLLNIEHDFAAIITPGLELAFNDRIQISLSGDTIMGEKATRLVWVCGPGAFVVLKALAFRNRGENKDAYDLYYVLRNYGADVSEVAGRVRSLRNDPSVDQALLILLEDFAEMDSLGPRRVAEFLGDSSNEELLTNVVGYVQALLAALN